MNIKTGNPKLDIDPRPPRPKTLKELYEFVVKICPSTIHINEENFFRAIITQLERDPIRTRSLKADVIEQSFNLTLPQSWPLNDFWNATEKYLKSLNASEEEISNFWKIIQDGFR